MTRTKSVLALVLATGLVGAAGVPAGAEADPDQPPAIGLYREQGDPGVQNAEVLVRYERSASSAKRAAARGKAGVRRVRALRLQGWELVEAEAGSADGAAARMRAQPGVVTAGPNGVAVAFDTTPNDPLFDDQWGLHNIGQVYYTDPGTLEHFSGLPDADVDAPAAWDTETGDGSVVVAVVDTGLRLSHPDLSGNLWTNPGETGDGKETDGVDNDGNGYIDDWRGWDWFGTPSQGDDNDPTDPSSQPHGTHVAGILGATDNDGGVVGVSWDVSIMPLRTLGGRGGSGSLGDIVDAMLYAADNGADIVNLSLGASLAPDSAEVTALNEAVNSAPDVLFVAAAGNEQTNNETTATYPCDLKSTNLICVAATTDADGLASFSNYGAKSVDLGAPGEFILSAWSSDGWAFLDGTSMATPMVSGAAALLLAADPSATVAELRQALLASGDALGALSGKTVTGRRLNVANALTWLLDPIFDDVLPSSWYYPYVQAIAREEITQGCSSQPPLYCPSSKVTRGQMAVFLIRAMQEDGNLLPYQGHFDDVPESSPYALYIERLFDLEITSGCGPDRYCPGSAVTRAQMAVFLIRALVDEGNLVPYQGIFNDVPESSPYALYIERLSDRQITSGCGPERYCPASSVTRGQMAVFIARAWNLVP